MAYTSVAALFTAICNSIRAKLGTTNPIAHQDIPSSIDAIVTGEGGSDVSGVTAAAGDVLSPKVFVNSLGVEVTGTISSKGAATYTPSESAQEIAAGQYLSGKQTISAIPSKYKDMTGTDAAAADLLNGKKAGNTTGQITGTMTNKGAVLGYISTKAGKYTIPSGYHNGSGSVAISSSEQDKIIAENIKSGVTILGVAGATNVVDTTNEVNSATDVTLLSGTKAFVNGESLTGTMPYIGAQNGYISTKAGTVVLTKGYHSGSGSVSISSTEQAKIIAGNIKSGVTILGQAGNSNVVDSSSGDATAGDIKSGKKAWVKGVEITGTNVGENWIGTLSFSGTYSSSTYIVQGSSGLFVDPLTGIAIIVIKSANHGTYKHININVSSIPSGVTMTDKTFTSDGYINLVLYTARFSGITGKINVSINCPSVSSGIIQANVTMTYV